MAFDDRVHPYFDPLGFRETREECGFSSLEELSASSHVPLPRLIAFEAGAAVPTACEFLTLSVKLLDTWDALPEDDQSKLFETILRKISPGRTEAAKALTTRAVDILFERAERELCATKEEDE